MGTINFYLKKPEPVKKNKETGSITGGKSLIILQWKYRGQRLVFSTGESINPRHWDSKKQRIKSNKETTADGKHHLNDLLDNLETQLTNIYNLEIKNGIPAPVTLKKHLKSFINQNIGVETKDTIWNLIERFISGEVRDKKNKKKTQGTLNSYKVVKGRLQAFDKKYKYNLSFENVNQGFLDKFLNYMEDDAKLSANTIAKTLQVLKLFMNVGYEREYHKNSWYKKNISVSWEESENVALSRREINKLYKYDFSDNTRLERVRDLFVFGCNVGLRISDFSNIKAHNLIEINGEKRIKIKTQKTQKEVEIPCSDQVLEILQKYNDVLPKISDQKFNDYIKEACEAAGLTDTGRLLKNPDMPLYNALSSHTCRRSFCTNLYNEGVKSIDIMKVSGHTTETAFLKYIKVSQTDAADKLSAHFTKMKQSNLIAV